MARVFSFLEFGFLGKAGKEEEPVANYSSQIVCMTSRFRFLCVTKDEAHSMMFVRFVSGSFHVIPFPLFFLK